MELSIALSNTETLRLSSLWGMGEKLTFGGRRCERGQSNCCVVTRITPPRKSVPAAVSSQREGSRESKRKTNLIFCLNSQKLQFMCDHWKNDIYCELLIQLPYLLPSKCHSYHLSYRGMYLLCSSGNKDWCDKWKFGQNNNLQSFISIRQTITDISTNHLFL